jgi:hypothetical protein
MHVEKSEVKDNKIKKNRSNQDEYKESIDFYVFYNTYT